MPTGGRGATPIGLTGIGTYSNTRCRGAGAIAAFHGSGLFRLVSDPRLRRRGASSSRSPPARRGRGGGGGGTGGRQRGPPRVLPSPRDEPSNRDPENDSESDPATETQGEVAGRPAVAAPCTERRDAQTRSARPGGSVAADR